MRTISKKWILICLIFIAIVLYFGFRPFLIKQQCSNEALDFGLLQGVTETKGTEEGRQAAIQRKELYELAYEQCLHSKGL